MGFNEEYLKLRKKRLKDEEDGKTREIITPYRRPLASDAPTSTVLNDDDIAPVKTSSTRDSSTIRENKEKTEEKERTWFKKSGLWDDGYQFGDVTKAILGTHTDAGENMWAGLLGIGEKAVDTLAMMGNAIAQGQIAETRNNEIMYEGLKQITTGEEARDPSKIIDDYAAYGEKVEKGVTDFVKKDLYDEEAVAKVLISDSYEKITGRDAEEDSVFGEKADDLAQSGGQLLGTAALQAVGVPAWLTIGATAFGSEAESALNQDATYEEAFVSGTISAGAEILTEKISGGVDFGMGTFDEGLSSALAANISSKTWQTLAKLGVDMAGEGAEEVFSNAISAIGQKITYDKDKDVSIKELFLSEDAFEAFIGGAVLGGVGSGGEMANNVIHGNDAVTGLKADTEQKVVDKLYKEALADAETDGKKLTPKDKKNLYDGVLNNLEKGYISTDVIEEVLGGEDYKHYQNEIKRQQDLDNELNELRNMKSGEMTDIQQERMSELKAMKPNTEMVKALKFGIDEQIRNSIKDTKLVESYNEKARRGQAFEADLSQYDSKQAEVVKRAIDSGILNNTNRTHEFVDLVAKISADKGVPFDFTNNEKIKETGFAVENATVNGYLDRQNNVIGVNIQSAKALNTVVGHEITHVLEGTELYGELSKVITEYAKSKGDYDGRIESLKNLYKPEDVDSELVADLVGEYLFEDTDFIKSLSVEHRNVFQKIYDEIKYLAKIATAGSKEAREFEKVKKAFEQAYRESGKASGNTKYSLAMVDAVKPTSDKWSQSATTDEVRAKHPTLYAVDETATEKRNPTQVKGTVGSYRNIYESLKAEGFNGTVLDASSGLGLGTKVGIEEYGFKVDDIEPYPDSSYKPKYTDYSALDKTYDVVISNAVLNVLPQDQRDALVVKMGESLNPGGRMFVNVRGKDVLNASGKIAINEANMEYFIPRTEKTGSYQKGFTRAELKAYLEDALGEGYKVEPTNILNGVSVVVTKDGGTKYSLSDSDGKKLTKEQGEYFKDSKMRDDNGNLKVMYHGSQDAGFHVFDPSMSDDGTSLFFVDRNDVAASYSGTSETYEAQTIRNAEDMNNFIESIGVEGYEVVENSGKFTLLYEGERVADSNTAKGIYEEFCWYEGVGEGDANYKVYLNLTNPLEIDARGKNWNNISREYSQEIADRYNSLTAEEKAALTNLAEWGEYSIFRDEMLEARATAEQGGYGVFDEAYTKNLAKAYEKLGGANANLYDAFSIASDNFSEESIKEFAVKQMNTRDFAKKAKAEGYDGVIFKNLVDVGGYGNGSEGPSTVAIAFNSEQVKSVANEKPTADKDIRYSLAEEDTKKLNDAGLEYDAKSETVSFSLSSLEDAFNYHTDESGVVLNEDDYQKARAEYVNALAKSIAADKGNPTAEEKMKASKYLDGLFLVHDMIAADKDRLDYEAAVDKSSWVSNSEYGGSIDFSTLCAKRRLFTGTFDAIQNALPDTVLDENDFLRIRDMLLEKELESPCSMCYVEGSRAKHGVYVDKWLKEYLATNPDWKPQIADFTSSTRLERTRIEHPEAYAEYQKAMNKLAQRKPKEASVRTDYKGEILVAFEDGSSVEIKNQNGGIRFNSFSDFEIIHALDCMQVITDMARVGLNGQAYTKVKEFAESFGGTGLKINLSLVAKDVDANGKLVMDEVNGMKYSEAMDIRNKYSDNVGTVIVVFNDAQVKAALADPTIDYVLPFHRSQWKKSQYTMMGLPTVTKDYTAIQNDRIRNPKTGKPVKLSKLKQATTYTNDITGETFVIRDNIMPNMYWDYSKSGRDNANRYLDYINANGMTPKFDFLLNKVDGKWTLPDDSVGDGYFKLLIDFKMYNNDGWGAPQNPVLPEFNMPYIQQMLDNYIGGHQSFPVAHDVVDKFVEGKKNGSFSLSAEGEAPVRKRGSIYGEDVRLEAPTRADVAPMIDNTVDEAVDESVPDGYAPIENAYTVEQELESVRNEMVEVFNEYNDLFAEGKEAEANALLGKFEELNESSITLSEKVDSLKAQERADTEGYLNSLGDADAPPEMDAPYNMPRGSAALDGKTLKSITKEAGDILGLDANDRAKMAETITRYAQDDSLTESDLFEEISRNFQYNEEISNNGDELQSAKKYMRGTKLFINANLKGDFNGKRKDGFNQFRKEHIGHFYLTTNEASNAMSVDQFYGELHEKFPGLFPDDIWNPAEQLQQMADVATAAPNVEYRSEPFDEETVQEVCDIISNGIRQYSQGETQKRLDADREAFYESVGVDIAPIAPTFETARKDQVSGQQAMFEDAQTIEAPIKEEPKVEAEPEEAPKIAKVLTEEPKTNKKRRGVWSMFKNNVLDKGMVFEDISLKTGNRELQAKWNSIRYARSKAQMLVGEGNESVKSLKSIKETVDKSGKTQEFYDYLYHLHNVDRMSLEANAAPTIEAFKEKFGHLELKQIQAIALTKITDKTTERTANTIREAGQYLQALDTNNKPVFGDEVTADVSRDTAAKLEKVNPEFKEWAQDVYDYTNYLRQMLVDEGVISQETADLWAQIYPHYVPIRRAGKDGPAINVALDTNRTGINAPIKRATGGNSDILPLFDTMALRTEQTYRAIAKNRFGVELKNTLGTTIDRGDISVDEAIDNLDNDEGLLKKGENGANPTFTVFENGERVEFEITEEMYDAIKPTSKELAYTNKVANTVGNVFRGLLTEYNLVFMVTNGIKDAQDILINSQHAGRTYLNIPTAIIEMATDGHWYREYIANGGKQNTYFDGETATFKETDSRIKKVVGMPLRVISSLNNIIERLPRLAEYIASRKNGASVDVAMLDAARVTTNFAAGGDLTKALNRNGFTFLNASTQGAIQQVRNVREAKANGFKGWLQLATKTAIAGIPALILNDLLWDDDEEYEELADYVKQDYYVVAKLEDGTFIRIPKGRTVAVIQDAFEQMRNLITGDDEVDMQSFFKLFVSNLAPNNPVEDNVLSPVMQVANNKTWYGEDLVPSRLQDMPEAEQYDESTDAVSKWLGEKLDYSPYKINYLLNQYSGGVGDVALPYLTPESDGSGVLAPFADKFTTNSTMNNQYVSDFYDTVDELTKNANSSKATDEDILKYKYMNSVNAELGELYQQKREIQNSDLEDEEKNAAVHDIQRQIDDIARESLDTYGDVDIDGVYATVGDLHYRWYVPSEDSEDEPHWEKISDKQLEKQDKVTRGLGITPSEYWGNKEEYDYAYDYPGKYAVAKSVGGYEAYKKYSSELYDIKADKDADGKSISGSRKEKVIDWINGLDADYGEKIILFKSEYNADDTYNYEIIDYLNSREDISYSEMETILKELGFTVDSAGNIYWD